MEQGVRSRIKGMRKIHLSKLRGFQGGNPKTPTDRDKSHLDDSLTNHGYVMPMAVRELDDGTYELIDGHQRTDRLLARNPDAEFECIVLDVESVLEGRRILLALQHHVDLDPRKLDDFVRQAMGEGAKAAELLMDTGFSDRELDAYARAGAGFLDGLSPDRSRPQATPQLTDAPVPAKAAAVTKKGDVWQLGDHVLWCGDCRADAYPFDERCQIAMTSPPYASQREYDAESGFEPVHPDKFVAWFEAVQAGVARLLLADGSWFVNIKAHADEGQRSLYVNDLVAAHVREWDWLFVDDFCWVKPGVPGSWPNRFKNAWEPVFHFSKQREIKMRPDAVGNESDHVFDYKRSNQANSKTGTRFTNQIIGKSRPGIARASNVIQTGNETSGAHSAPYPIALPTFFVAAFTDKGDHVFEPFCGSGTTLVAAEQLERRCFAIEISPVYCDLIIERWQQFTGRKAQRCG